MTATVKAPVLLVGAGALGSALLQGWRKAGVIRPEDLMILDPAAQGEAQILVSQGAKLNPPSEEISKAQTVILAVKPAHWRKAAEELSSLLPQDALLVSMMAGVRTIHLQTVFAPRKVVRVMPTTGVAVAKGVASLYSRDDEARAVARKLLENVATVVDLEDEDQMDAATAVSGSGPAYLYAFTAALELAALKSGLPRTAARTLARATVASAAHMMAESGREPEDLITQVASPGGTTEAALAVLRGPNGLPSLMEQAVNAAMKRAEELGH